MKLAEIALDLEGRTLARPVKNSQGVTMLEEGTRLTAAYLKRLRQMGIQDVCIEVEKSESDSSEKSAAPAIRFRQVRDALAVRVEDRSLLGPWGEENLSRINGLFSRISARYEVMRLLEQLAAYDQCLIQHSIQVARLTGYMGMKLDYDDELLTDVLIGALLFDIGMTKLPLSLVKSKSALSMEQRLLLESHTHQGCHLLSGIEAISPLSATCALLHHERYDGSGYPLRLKGDDIPEYVQLIGIADVYDALISPRHHRMPYSEVEAAEYLFASGNHIFAADLVQLFLQHLSAYPIATNVRLSTGQEAIVANYRSKLIYRPVVRVVREADGSAIEHPYELDLLEVHNVVIVSAL